MADKTILQLPNNNPTLSDTSVFSDAGGTFGYTFNQLLALLQLNISAGAVITFGTGSIPSNSVGSNGDVYWKTDTGQIAQRQSGAWVVTYTITPGVMGSTIYYGTAAASGGIDGDSYIQTVGGIFSKKIAGAWVTQFTMATGPTGPAGANGSNGTNGSNGKTVLNGTVNPSNGLGTDGDFYINTTTSYFFGPKASGVWPAGFSLIGATLPDPFIYNLPAGSLTPVIIDFSANTIKIGTASAISIGYNLADYQSNPSIKFEIITSADNTSPKPSEPWISNKQWSDNTYTSLVAITIQPDTDTGLPGGLTLDNINIIIKP